MTKEVAGVKTDKQSSKYLSPSRRKSRSLRFYWTQQLNTIYRRFRALRGKPRVIARGLAIGVFAGCFPFFGFQIIIGVLLATGLRGNKFAAMLGTWISNPFTYVPIFAFNYQVGRFLLRQPDFVLEQFDPESLSHLMEFGYWFLSTLLLGCFFMGVIAAMITYFVSLWLIHRFSKKRT